MTSGRIGSALRAVRADEQHLQFLSYISEVYRFYVFSLIAMIAEALSFPQAGIFNPAAAIWLAMHVTIGGRGRLYGAVPGAVFVTLISSAFTSGQVPVGFHTIQWVAW